MDIKKLTQEIIVEFSSIEMIQEIGMEIPKKFDNIENEEILDSYTRLLYCLYVIGSEVFILEFIPFIYKIKPTNNKSVWGRVEAILLLFSRIYKEKNKLEEANKYLKQVKKGFEIGRSESTIKINAKARKRKLSGQLINLDKIKYAESNGDKVMATEYRLVLLQDLFYISELGCSEQMPKERVESEIKNNLEYLKRYLINN